MNLFFCDELPASMGDASVPVHKIRNNPQPEGRQARSDTHRTDYEGAGGKGVFQWLPGIKSHTDRLGKKGVRVSRRFFGDFLCVQKVTRGLGPGRPRRGEPGSGAQGEFRRRRQRGQPGLGSPGSHVPKRLASDAPVRSPHSSSHQAFHI